jgi:hypothetical protein
MPLIARRLSFKHCVDLIVHWPTTISCRALRLAENVEACARSNLEYDSPATAIPDGGLMALTASSLSEESVRRCGA